MFTLALAGDTMLGRSVATALARDPRVELFDPALRDVLAEADRFVLNLECCISHRGERWPDPYKPFFFRAPPVAATRLRELGVDAVTLANNHALDYGDTALLDTLDHLRAAGIGCVGAGANLASARRPLAIDETLTLLAFTDHPAEFAAGEDKPGVAWVDLGRPLPKWVDDALREAATPIRLVMPHWGPNMTTRPSGLIVRAAEHLASTGATIVAGHSAHVFHGIRVRVGPGGSVPVLFDLGDFIDDYARDPVLRNDLGLLWLVRFDRFRPRRIEAVPLELDFCHTRVARGASVKWIVERLTRACAELGTAVRTSDGRIELDVPT